MRLQREDRTAERNDLLSRLTQLLQNYPLVCSAWLIGSLARGASDCWSDIDVVVVLEDNTFDELAADPASFASRFGERLFVVYAPQNAAPGGQCLHAEYDAPRGPYRASTWPAPRTNHSGFPLSFKTCVEILAADER